MSRDNPQPVVSPRPESCEAASATARELVGLIAERRAVDVLGLAGAARGWVARHLVQPGRAKLLLAVAAEEDDAQELALDLAFFLRGKAGAPSPVLHVPADPVLPYDDLSPDRALEMERLAALSRLLFARSGVRAVVVSARALARRMVPPLALERQADLVGKGIRLDRDAFAAKLVALGYVRAPLVEDPGTFAVRGGIFDVWSPAHDKPVRLELFGDEVESARAFDPETQRSDQPGDAPRAGCEEVEVTILPAREAVFTEEGKTAAKQAVRDAAERVNRPTSRVREVLDAIEAGTPFFGLEALLPGFHPGGLATLFDYLPAALTVWIDGPEAVSDALQELEAQLAREHEASVGRQDLTEPPQAHFLSASEARECLARFPCVLSHRVYVGRDAPLRFDFKDTSALRAEIEGAHGEEGALVPLARRLEDWRTRGLTAVVSCSSRAAADRLKRLLEGRRLASRSHTGPLGDPGELYDPAIHAHLLEGDVTAGFVDEGSRLALLSDEEIFGRRVRKRARATRIENAFAVAFRDLNEGDLVVHVEHGIARYLGLTKMQIRGVEGDFLVLAYEGADRLYLPVSKLRLVQKFAGASPDAVRLDRLGGSSFALRRARVKEQLLKMAGELIAIYAARSAHPGFGFKQPDEVYREFEAEFPYEPTPDQARAIEDLVADMCKGGARSQKGPMDRLVCGDVGYGKTEVAMRAAMLAVLSRKQVAVLVPTTVLASQHERTFRERFQGYPVRIEAISRMKEGGETRAILRDLSAGKVDVVIGTHRLLGADVSFKDLGLVVIDEEQRFGVAHKERLKRLRKLVDVLTLTATPIPRTLHMSLAGARDLSIIATPPEDRRAIRTFVMKFDPPAVKQAVEQEVRRGGQVFFVHNRVRSIGSMERFLRDLVPGARIGVAHGQMAEGKLEEVMSRFVEKKLDLLLTTSIIESGLDIPSANTVLVNRADQFGLAQLYQIRGRVGRSRERAYAYLLVPARRPVTKDAQKRLEVLQRFSELGAGFKIASHDLEIRGAGNLLGKDQSGHIEAIGFDLYTQLLEEAVRELKGEAPPEQEIDPDVQLPIPAFIPDPYMPDVHQRLYFYKRFAQASTDEELAEVRAEIVDRYGEPPGELDALQAVMEVKVRLRALRIRGLEAGPGRIVFTLGDGAALDPYQLAKKVQASNGALRLTPDMKLVVRLGPGTQGPASPAAGSPRAARSEKVAAAVARAVAKARPSPAAPPLAQSPEVEAAQGRELLGTVRRLLAELPRS